MADFETSAALEIEVPQSSLRSARQVIEDELGDVSLGVGAAGSAGGGPPAATDGGGLSPQRRRRITRQSFDLAQERTETLNDILEVLEDGDLGGGGGGGGLLGGGGLGLGTVGGGVLAGALTTGGGGLLGRLAPGGPLAAALTNPFTGAVAAGGAAGLGLRGIFESVSFDESTLDTDADQVSAELATTISDELAAVDVADVFEQVRTNGLILEDAGDINQELAGLLAEETPVLTEDQIVSQLREADLIDVPSSEETFDALFQQDGRLAANAEGERLGQQDGRLQSAADRIDGRRDDEPGFPIPPGAETTSRTNRAEEQRQQTEITVNQDITIEGAAEQELRRKLDQLKREAIQEIDQRASRRSGR